MKRTARARAESTPRFDWASAFGEAAEAVLADLDSPDSFARWRAGRETIVEAARGLGLSGARWPELPLFELLAPFGADVRWVIAIKHWIEGDELLLARQLGGDDPVPGFARAFLAALVSGQVPKRRGPKRSARGETLKDELEKLVADERVRESYARHHAARKAQRRPRGAKGDTPSYQAIDDVAAELKMTRHQVEAIVHPRTKASARDAGNNSA